LKTVLLFLLLLDMKDDTSCSHDPPNSVEEHNNKTRTHEFFGKWNNSVCRLVSPFQCMHGGCLHASLITIISILHYRFGDGWDKEQGGTLIIWQEFRQDGIFILLLWASLSSKELVVLVRLY
jgi:hypothetical protein